MTYRWSDVDRAIREAVADPHGLHAVDVEAMAQRVSSVAPNPRRTPTVRRTGSEGSRPRRDPLDAVARGRMQAILDELQPVMRAAVIATATGYPLRKLASDLRAVGHAFRDSSLYDVAALGKGLVAERMRQKGLLE